MAADATLFVSQYDVSKPCPTLHENLCYSATDRIKSLLDDRKTRKKLGVPEDRPEFVGCSNAVGVIVAPGAPHVHAPGALLMRLSNGRSGLASTRTTTARLFRVPT